MSSPLSISYSLACIPLFLSDSLGLLEDALICYPTHNYPHAQKHFYHPPHLTHAHDHTHLTHSAFFFSYI